jgi:hypothetical protein
MKPKQPTIIVVNLREYTGEGIYIGRKCGRFPEGSPLANPHWFRHSPNDGLERNLSIAKYTSDLEAACKNPASPQSIELLRLSKLAEKEGKLVLICWCKPKACHGDVVRTAILALLKGKKCGKKKSAKILPTTT